MAGLAEQGMAQVDPQMVQQVATMLAQGVSPEELMSQGVPQQVVEMAMAMLQEQAAQQQQTQVAPDGLAARALQ